MKFMAGLVAGAALTLAPFAHAQVACEPFEILVDLAWDDFDDIIGEERDDGIYDADYQFDGADQCTVTIDFFAEYACLFVYPSEAEAAGVYAEALGLFDTCLSDWKREEFKPADSGGEFTSIQSLVAMGPDDLGDLEWFLSFERHNRPEGPDWHVVVGLSYF